MESMRLLEAFAYSVTLVVVVFVFYCCFLEDLRQDMVVWKRVSLD